MNNYFMFNNLRLNYIEPFVNSERRFEIPLLKFFLEVFQYHTNVIEIGAVSPYCNNFPMKHNICDPTDPIANIKDFAENLNYNGMNVISISTIEHIGRGDYMLEIHPYRCITVLNKILESDNYLVTFPIGYNLLLDNYCKFIIPKNITYTAHRINDDNDWMVDDVLNFDYQYDFLNNRGNAVCVVCNLNELKK